MSILPGVFREKIHWVGFLAAATTFLVLAVRLQPWTYDDTFIFLRYADNFAHGDGPVYNVGERVEGYTSFLWMLLLTGGLRLGVPPLPLVKGLGVFFGLGTLLLAAHTHRFVPGVRRSTSAVAAVLAGLCGPFTTWSICGMEIGLAGFVALGTILIHCRARGPQGSRGWRRLGAVSCALSMACRPEFVLLTGVLFLDWLRWSIRKRDRAAVEFAALVAAVYVPYFAWRWWYYGWPLPNTFYAKVGHSWDQVERGLRGLRGLAGRAAILFAAVSFGLVTRRLGVLAAGAAWFVVHTMYVVSIGGGPQQYHAAALPVAAVVTAVVLSPLLRRPVWVAAVVLASFLLDAHGAARQELLVRVHRRSWLAASDLRARDLGLWLRDHAPPGAVLAVNAAGQVPFYSRLPVIDMLGLNDEHIAHRPVPMGSGAIGHEKTDADYILSRKPTWIQFGGGRGRSLPLFVSDAALFRHPEFGRWYAMREIELPDGARARLYERLERPRPAAEWDAERQGLLREKRSDRNVTPSPPGARAAARRGSA
ncbi:hypothetical protein K8I85_04150 [bacterium]|nr:hypothetical protein [bacterium]